MPKILQTPERVLPTLNADGSRRWLRPRQFAGRYLRARRWVGWGLVGLFCGLPFVRVGGKPAVLLDVPAREFHLFGRTFFATDGALLMLLMLTIFVSIFLLTAVLGRAWCGWACPQTVYMELLFRPLERFIEGGYREQKRLDREGPNARRVVKYVVFALLAVVLANVFLSYFVGTHRLARWMTSTPWDQPAGFAVVAVTSGLIFADFVFFREQMCTVACPYARLQSVLLDPRSLVVGYDARRGEPRGAGKSRAGKGDCVDCGACVAACPTGIDIREGLQLECIACTQCVDACDSVMRKFQRPEGLIRLDAQYALAGREKRSLPRRVRLYIYSAVLAGLLGGLLVLGGGGAGPDVTLLRGIGAPFVVEGESVRNQVRIKIQNRSTRDARFTLALEEPAGLQLIAPENPLPVRGERRQDTSVFVTAPKALFVAGELPVVFSLTDEQGGRVELAYRLLGPRRETAP